MDGWGRVLLFWGMQELGLTQAVGMGANGPGGTPFALWKLIISFQGPAEVDGWGRVLQFWAIQELGLTQTAGTGTKGPGSR